MKLKKQNGFSLVELMVVVAIIGILAAMGIPQYNKFRAKAYESEAKGQLASLYTAETAFYTEYQGYHTSLKVLGVGPQGKVRFNVGFGAVGVIPAGAPIETNILSTRVICGGAYGAGTDQNCDMVIDTPDIIAAASTTTAVDFAASALAFDDLLLASQGATVQNTPLLMLASALLSVQNANALPARGVSSIVNVWQINSQKKMTQSYVTYACVTSDTCRAITPPISP